MVKRNYTGVSLAEIQAVIPFTAALGRWQGKYRPFGPEYHAIQKALDAANEMVVALTGLATRPPYQQHGGGFPGHGQSPGSPK